MPPLFDEILAPYVSSMLGVQRALQGLEAQQLLQLKRDVNGDVTPLINRHDGGLSFCSVGTDGCSYLVTTESGNIKFKSILNA